MLNDTASQIHFATTHYRVKIYGILLFSLITASLGATEGVVLLHGLWRSSSSMEEMETELMDAGFFVVNFAYPSRSASVEELSDLAIGEALKDAKLEDCSKIHFVAHSLGGLLIRSYFARHEHSRLGRVVMLGPPNQGSEVADNLSAWWLYRKINGPAGIELGTDGESTPIKLGPVDFELGVIAGDRSINWINSMMIEGSDDGKVSVERTKVEGMSEHIVLHVTHPYLMKSDEVIEATLRFLETGSFASEMERKGD